MALDSQTSQHSIDRQDSGSSQERWTPPYMPWFESDFAGAFNVRNMKPLPRLMYRSLLQQGWRSDKPPYLPNNDALLRLMADAPSEKIWAKHRAEILSRFQITEDGKWLFHTKSLREYNRAVAEHERKVAGGLQRWQGDRKHSGSSAPTQHEHRDVAPLSSHNHIYNQPTSTTNPLGAAGSVSDEADSSDGTDELIDEICESHPRLQKRTLTEQYVVSALQAEIARGRTLSEALDYLLDRTLLYRKITSAWQEDEQRFVLSSAEFFRSGEYRTDPKFWQRGHSGGSRQNPLPSATPAPASETIKKRLEEERQTAQKEEGEVTA